MKDTLEEVVFFRTKETLGYKPVACWKEFVNHSKGRIIQCLKTHASSKELDLLDELAASGSMKEVSDMIRAALDDPYTIHSS